MKERYYIKEIILGAILYPIAIGASYIGIFGPESPTLIPALIPIVLGVTIYYFYAKAKQSNNPVLASIVLCLSGLIVTGIVFAYILYISTP